ncbi:hypothetical protein JCM16303_001096 [Sporobolomyces ruberrimus]
MSPSVSSRVSLQPFNSTIHPSLSLFDGNTHSSTSPTGPSFPPSCSSSSTSPSRVEILPPSVKRCRSPMDSTSLSHSPPSPPLGESPSSNSFPPLPTFTATTSRPQYSWPPNTNERRSLRPQVGVESNLLPSRARNEEREDRVRRKLDLNRASRREREEQSERRRREEGEDDERWEKGSDTTVVGRRDERYWESRPAGVPAYGQEEDGTVTPTQERSWQANMWQ